jgi:hypothetical protein
MSNQNINIVRKILPAFPLGTGYQLNINQNMNISYILPYISGDISTIYVNNGCILTIDQNIMLPENITGLAGPGTITINSGVTLYINQNINCTLSTINGNGTLQINSGYTFTFSGNNLIPSGLIANGILALSGNYTLGTSLTNGSGNLQINSGFTLTVSQPSTLGYAPVNLGFNSITGSGTLTIATDYTLQQINDLVIGVSTVNVKGYWNNAGYNITVPSNSTVEWFSNSITTASTPGTLIVNGAVFWFGNGIGYQTTDAVPTFPLNLSGTGIFIGGLTASAGSASATISLSNTSLGPGSSSVNTTTASGGSPYFTFSMIQGNSIGKYGLGVYDITGNKFNIWVLIYLGSTSAFTNMSGLPWTGNTANIISGDTVAIHSASGSAGTITLTGTAYIGGSTYG